MNTVTRFALMRRAVSIYPMTIFDNDSAVKHARRGWLRSIEILGDKWLLKQPVRRTQ